MKGGLRGFLVGAALVLASCGGQEPTSQVAGYKEFLSSDAQTLRVSQIQYQAEVDSCMRGKGFELESQAVPPVEFFERSLGLFTTRTPEYLLTMTEEQAATTAFGIALAHEGALEGVTFEPFPQPNLDDDPSAISREESAYRLALWGDGVSSADSCVSSSSEGVSPVEPPVDQVEIALDLLYADTEFGVFAEKWESCVRREGIDLGTFPAAFGAIQLALDQAAADELGTEPGETFSSGALSENDLAGLRELEFLYAGIHAECLKNSDFETALSTWEGSLVQALNSELFHEHEHEHENDHGHE